MSEITNAQVKRYYRIISGIFITCVVLIGLGVALSGWSSATISVTPYRQTLSTKTTVTVVPTSDGADPYQLIGTITTEEHSASVTVEPKGTGTPVPAHASGTITIKNTTASPQPLAAGTRLRSTSDVIVRTDRRVDVPAGGQIQVRVLADPLGTEGEVEAGQLTIVALWPGLQDKIFGIVTTPLSGGLASSGQTLSVDELSTASDQAEQQIRKEIGQSSDGKLLIIEPSGVSSNPKSTVPSAQYSVTVTAQVSTITYSSSRLQDIARSELEKIVTEGLRVTSVDTTKLTIQDRPTKDQVVLDLSITGTASIDPTSALVQPETYSGLSRAAIEKKLLTSSVQKAEVRLSPIWRRTAPEQAKRITVRLLPAVIKSN